MKGKIRLNKIQSSMVISCIAGILTALTVSILLTALQSGLIGSNKIGESTTNTIIFMIRVLSVTIGCFLAAALTKNRILPTIGITAAGYLVVLFGIGIAAFNGSFENLGSGLLSTLLGGAIPGIIKSKAPKRSRKIHKLY